MVYADKLTIPSTFQAQRFYRFLAQARSKGAVRGGASIELISNYGAPARRSTWYGRASRCMG